MASMINKAKAKLHEHKEKKQEVKETKEQQNTPSTESKTKRPSGENTGENTGENAGSQSQPLESQDESTESLNIHNKTRSSKGLCTMDWDSQLAQEATKYAEKLAHKGKMEHSGTEGQGENLYMSTGDASFGDAVQSWLEEEKDYKGEKIGEGDFAKWGHFSQCLWHSTTKVGLGKAKSAKGETFVVGRYTPQGNMAGEKPFSV